MRGDQCSSLKIFIVSTDPLDDLELKNVVVVGLLHGVHARPVVPCPNQAISNFTCPTNFAWCRLPHHNALIRVLAEFYAHCVALSARNKPIAACSSVPTPTTSTNTPLSKATMNPTQSTEELVEHKTEERNKTATACNVCAVMARDHAPPVVR